MGVDDAKTIRGVHHPSWQRGNTIFKRRININITIRITSTPRPSSGAVVQLLSLRKSAPGHSHAHAHPRIPGTDRCDGRIAATLRRTLGARMRDEGQRASGKGKGKGNEMDGRWDTTHPDPEGWEKGYKPPERAGVLFSFSFFRL